MRPREGGLRQGEIFWLRLATASAQCLRLYERFFHSTRVVPRTGFQFVSERALSVVGAKLLNSLRVHLGEITDSQSFKQQTKTSDRRHKHRLFLPLP